MKIYRISQAQQQPQATPQQVESQKTIQEAMGQIMESAGLINKSLETMQNNQTEKLFTKDGIMNSLQNGDIRRVDQNRVNQSLESMAAISQASLAINQALRAIENEGGNVNEVLAMTVQSIQTGNYSMFQSTMSNFQSNLTGMTGTIQNVVPTL